MSQILQTAVDEGAHDAPIPSGGASPVRKPLGTLLLDAGFIDQIQLDEALSDGTATGERVGEVVVRRGWATEDDVARLLADQWELSYLDRASIWFDASALGRLSREDAQKLEALPVRVEEDRVVVAVAEPTEQRLAELRRVIGEDTVVVVVPKTALDAGIRSELLTSRQRPAADEPVADEPVAAEETFEPHVQAIDSEPEVADAQVTAPAPELYIAPLPTGAVMNLDGLEGVSALAAQARSVADAITAQAGAMQEYERRIEALETELAETRATMHEAREQLATVAQLLALPKPSV